MNTLGTGRHNSVKRKKIFFETKIWHSGILQAGKACCIDMYRMVYGKKLKVVKRRQKSLAPLEYLLSFAMLVSIMVQEGVYK